MVSLAAGTSLASARTPSVSRVPPEILHEIFLRHPGYADAEVTSFKNGHRCIKDTDCGPLCWAVVSHVCRRWRAVALHSPSLWTRLTVSPHPEWMAELLHRSAKLPLQITANLDQEDLREERGESFELVLRQLSRIRDLFFASLRPLRHEAVKLMAGAAPLLQILVIGGSPVQSRIEEGQFDNDYIYFPALLHHEKSPRLERLEVRGAFHGINLYGPCASTLKHLSFRTIIPHLPWPNVSAFLDVLSMLPSLETVALERHVLEPPPFEWLNLTDVRLPHLHTLNLHTTASECTVLLLHLDLPALSSLGLSAVYTFDSVDTLVPAIASKISGLDAPRALYVKGFGKDEDPGALEVSGFVGPAADCLEWSTRSFDVVLKDCYDHAEALTEICKRISLKDVSTLDVEGEDVPSEAWLDMAEQMDSLVYLSVTGAYAIAGLPEMLLAERTLSPELEGANEDEGGGEEEALSERLYLPNLTNIYIYDACLGRRSDHDAGQPGPWVEHMCQALKVRDEAKVGPAQVHFDDCSNVNQAMFAALEDTEVMVDFVRSNDSVRNADDWEWFMPV
ncbi:uncharacterized protein B0H18DRAFT_339456 [Fomitopsis serialis]|uniref:uncharacterized protein n=1 Tax=Fomitopsis serialis TaxID=139415 RepID=UPI0020082AE4|nr:uncharacterized protein B0H18DRAFT_339456 [Neoantrodia serialis]KAH9926376.1 hypothetical protein B0H18DRAFT_339456 [Neoantrodia serialis]